MEQVLRKVYLSACIDNLSTSYFIKSGRIQPKMYSSESSCNLEMYLCTKVNLICQNYEEELCFSVFSFLTGEYIILGGSIS